MTRKCGRTIHFHHKLTTKIFYLKKFLKVTVFDDFLPFLPNFWIT